MRLYKKSLQLILASRLAYRADFIFTFISVSLWALSMTVFAVLLYSAGAGFPNWQFYEVLVFLGIFNIFLATASMISLNFFHQVQQTVREGELELILTKPVNEIYYLLSKSFEYESLGEIVIGIILLTIGVMNTQIELNILLLTLYFFSAIIAYFSMVLFASTLAIRFVKTERLMDILHQLFNLGEHPKNLFPKGIQTTFTIMIPVFVLSYYPASAILGYEVQYPYLVIVSCIIFFLLALLFWKKTLTTYTGAGG